TSGCARRASRHDGRWTMASGNCSKATAWKGGRRARMRPEVRLMKREPLDLTAAILAGGLGTRLRPVLADRPKVLAPVGGRPFVACLLDQLTRTGVREIVLLAGYRAGQLRAALGNAHEGIPLRYSVEEMPLGTAGALRH